MEALVGYFQIGINEKQDSFSLKENRMSQKSELFKINAELSCLVVIAMACVFVCVSEISVEYPTRKTI